MGRSKKYDWSDKKDLCYRLYVEEERPMQDVRKYFSEALGVAEENLPSSQSFNRQFREWQFPPRFDRIPADDEKIIVERIKQLWEQNHGNVAITETLQSEGWEITELKVGRLRRKHKLSLRAGGNYLVNKDPAHGETEQHASTTPGVPPGTQQQQQQDVYNMATLPAQAYQDQNLYDAQSAPAQSYQDQHSYNAKAAQTHSYSNQSYADHHYPAQHAYSAVDSFSGLNHQHAELMPAASLPYQMASAQPSNVPMETPSSSRKRAQELMDGSEEPLQQKKRRRRIRGCGLVPADAPGAPPRYKSETSLNECKVYLHVDNKQYQAIRQQYMDICNEMGIVKKTKCEPGQWEASKDRLISENSHINAVMHAPHPDANAVANALEVVCADVTKRIRVQTTRISIQDANNGLQLNPAESKHARHLFYELLAQEDYNTMVELGDERWEQLFQLWLTKSDALIRIQQQGIDDQTRKFLRVLTRDASKRLNDTKVKSNPLMRNWIEGAYGPGPGAARAKIVPKPPKAPKQPKKRGARASNPASLDPSLSVFAPIPPPPPPPIPLPIDAEFHLAPESRLVGYHPKQWPGVLEKCSVAGVHKAGTSKTGAAKVGQVFGLVRAGGGEGQVEGVGVEEGEAKYFIGTDEDLIAYLQVAKDFANEKVVFLIELSGGYA